MAGCKDDSEHDGVLPVTVPSGQIRHVIHTHLPTGPAGVCALWNGPGEWEWECGGVSGSVGE